MARDQLTEQGSRVVEVLLEDWGNVFGCTTIRAHRRCIAQLRNGLKDSRAVAVRRVWR